MALPASAESGRCVALGEISSQMHQGKTREAKQWLSREIESSRTLHKCHVLGSGTFGKVYAARACNGWPVAIKVEDLQDMRDESSLWDELGVLGKILQAGGHRNIVPLASFFWDTEACAAYYLLGAPGFMDLRSFQQNCAMALPGEYQGAFSSDILSGLAFLHRLDIIHRDLKPGNCILCAAPLQQGSFTLKTTDFNSSRLGRGRPTATVGFGTQWYRGPEATTLARPVAGYTCKFDVWSIGCILAEFALGQVLFYAPTQDDVSLHQSCMECPCPHVQLSPRVCEHADINTRARAQLETLVQ